MIVKHLGKTPRIDPSAYVAPNAVLCGDVSIAAGCRILFGAQVIAEGGAVAIGAECIVMENAVLRSTARHPLTIGNNCLIGPNAHVVGCRIEDQASQDQAGAPGAEVAIGWIAVGDPAQILPPNEHDKIWATQKPLNFPLTVYGLGRDEADMVKITRRVAEALAGHRDDEVVMP